MDRMPYMINILLSNESSYMYEFTSHFNITHNTFPVLMFKTKMPK